MKIAFRIILCLGVVISQFGSLSHADSRYDDCLNPKPIDPQTVQLPDSAAFIQPFAPASMEAMLEPQEWLSYAEIFINLDEQSQALKTALLNDIRAYKSRMLSSARLYHQAFNSKDRHYEYIAEQLSALGLHSKIPPEMPSEMAFAGANRQKYMDFHGIGFDIGEDQRAEIYSYFDGFEEFTPDLNPTAEEIETYKDHQRPMHIRVHDFYELNYVYLYDLEVSIDAFINFIFWQSGDTLPDRFKPPTNFTASQASLDNLEKARNDLHRAMSLWQTQEKLLREQVYFKRLDLLTRATRQRYKAGLADTRIERIRAYYAPSIQQAKSNSDYPTACHLLVMQDDEVAPLEMALETYKSCTGQLRSAATDISTVVNIGQPALDTDIAWFFSQISLREAATPTLAYEQTMTSTELQQRFEATYPVVDCDSAKALDIDWDASWQPLVAPELIHSVARQDDSSNSSSNQSQQSNNSDLQAIQELLDALDKTAKDCQDGKCQPWSCERTAAIMQAMYDLETLLYEQNQWIELANAAHVEHFKNLMNQGRITGENLVAAQEALAIQSFLHNMGSMLLDIASVSYSIEQGLSKISKGELNTSDVGSLLETLDDAYELGKDAESYIDTALKEKGFSGGTPIADAVPEIGILSKDDLNTLKSDLSDLKTIAQEIYKLKGAAEKLKQLSKSRDLMNAVGQAVGRHLKAWSENEMQARKAKIAEHYRNLGAEEVVASSFFTNMQSLQARRFMAQDAHAHILKTRQAMEDCITTYCGLPLPKKLTLPSFVKNGPNGETIDSWGDALRYIDQKLPEQRQRLANLLEGSQACTAD